MDEDDLKTNIVQDDGISVYKFTDNFLLKELTKSLGNSPSHEGLENITDNNQQTKFLNMMGDAKEFDVNFLFDKPIEIFGYGIRSANDCPGRDPRKWIIKFKLLQAKISEETQPEQKVVEQETTWDNRQQLKHFFLQDPVLTDKVTFTFTLDYKDFDYAEASVYCGQPCIQLAEIMFHSEKHKVNDQEILDKEKMNNKDKPSSCYEKVQKFINRAQEVILCQKKKLPIDGYIYVYENQLGLGSLHLEEPGLNHPLDFNTFSQQEFPKDIKLDQEFPQFINLPKRQSGSYISYATSDWTTDDGQLYPEKKYFLETHYDSETRIFTGWVDWTVGQVIDGGSFWQYYIEFSEDFQTMKNGQVITRDKNGKITETEQTNRTLYTENQQELKPKNIINKRKNAVKNKDLKKIKEDYDQLMQIDPSSKEKITKVTETDFYAITYSQNILSYCQQRRSLRIHSIHQAAKEIEDNNENEEIKDIYDQKGEKIEIAKCTKDHTLEFRTKDPYGGGARCDECKTDNCINMGYLFHCPACKYDLCKDCDFKRHGKIIQTNFKRCQGFYEESISEFLEPNELITALNLDEYNNTVWLGTNLGLLLNFSSRFLTKKEISIKANDNSQIKQILLGNTHCFALQQNGKIIKFKEQEKEYKLINQKEDEQLNNIALKLSDNKRYLAVCQKREEILIDDTQGLESNKQTIYELVIYDLEHIEKTVNKDKQEVTEQPDEQNKQDVGPIEKEIGRYNLTLHPDEINNIEQQFKLIPEWLCFSKDSKSIFIRSRLRSIKQLVLEHCEIVSEFKKVYENDLYLTKIQSFTDEKMIVCLGKGEGEQGRNNIRILNLQTKTNTILKTQYIINDFVVTQDKQWIFTVGAFENSSFLQFEMYSLLSPDYINIDSINSGGHQLNFQLKNLYGEDSIIYIHNSKLKETCSLKLVDFSVDTYEKLSNLDHPRYTLVKYEQQKFLFDKNFDLPVKLLKNCENFEIEFVYQDFIYGQRTVGFDKKQILRINSKTAQEEIIIEINNTELIKFKVTKNSRYLFFQQKLEICSVDIHNKQILDKLEFQPLDQTYDFQFQIFHNEMAIIAFFGSLKTRIDCLNPKKLKLVRQITSKKCYQINSVSKFTKNNQFLVLNGRQGGIRIFDVNTFKFDEFKDYNLVSNEFMFFHNESHIILQDSNYIKNMYEISEAQESQNYQDLLNTSGQKKKYQLINKFEIKPEIICQYGLNKDVSSLQINEEDYELNQILIEQLKENQFKPVIKKKEIAGRYNKLFQYFIKYYNDLKYQEQVSDLMKQLISQLVLNVQYPGSFGFLSYLVLQEGKEEYLQEAFKNENLLFLVDQSNYSPLDYAVKSFQHKKTNMLIEYLTKNPYYLDITTHQQVIELLKFSPSRLYEFFENSIKTIDQFAKIGIDKNENYEDFITVDNVLDNREKIEEGLLKQDAEEIEKRPIDLNQLRYPLNLTLGSEESIKLQLALQDCKRQNIFETKAMQQLIEYKWQRIQNKAWFIASFQFSFVIFVTLHLYMPGYLGPLIMLYIYIGLFFAKESYTMYAIWVLADKFTIKYNNLCNIALIPILIVYCIMKIIDDSLKIDYLLAVIDLLGWLSFVVQIKFHEVFREFITIFIKSFTSIKSFIWFFVLMMFAFTCVSVIIQRTMNNNDQFDENQIEQIDFTPEFYQQNGLSTNTSYNMHEGAQAFYKIWLTMLGQGESGELDYFQQCYYILVTFILQVTLLSILVAQYGDTFVKYQEQKEIYDGQVKNNIIIEIEIWTLTNRKAQSHEILVWMEYEKDENEEDQVKNSQILEELNQQKKLVDELKKEMKTQNENLEDKLSVQETKLKDQLNKILSKLEKNEIKKESPIKQNKEKLQSDLKEIKVNSIEFHPKLDDDENED